MKKMLSFELLINNLFLVFYFLFLLFNILAEIRASDINIVYIGISIRVIKSMAIDITVIIRGLVDGFSGIMFTISESFFYFLIYLVSLLAD